MFDLIFSTLLIAQVPEPPEPQWIEVDRDLERTIYYDANSFRGRDNYRTVTILFASNIGKEPLQPTMYIECKSRNKGLYIMTEDFDVNSFDRKQLRYPNPNTLPEYMINVTCPRVFKR